MRKVQLVFTFDYELPMGSCRDYQKGLFEPSAKLLNLCNELNIPVVLFADVCSLQMFKDWDYTNYYVPFTRQVQLALKQDSDVQLHIHPHWITSEYKDNKYVPSNKFCLSDYKNEASPRDVDSIIKNAVGLLTDICKEASPDYRCVAYRGGGYNLEPDTDLIFSTLFKYGIRIDSSVVKNLYLKTDLQKEDYRKTPADANWFISLNGDITTAAKEGMFEIPVTTMPPFLHHRIARIIKKIRNKERYKRLRYDHTGTGYSGAVSDFISKLITTIYSPFVLSFDNFTNDVKVIDTIVSYNLKKYDQDFIMCANSHPKSWGSYQFELFQDSVNLIKTKYAGQIEITTFQNIAKNKPLL